MNEETLKICGEAIDLARRLLAERDTAHADLKQVTREHDNAYEAFRTVVKERDTLREKVRSLTGLLADAEAKIENFEKALDTEVRR